MKNSEKQGLRFSLILATYFSGFGFAAAFGGAHEAAQQVFQSRLRRDAGALENNVATDAVDGIGVFLHTKSFHPVPNYTGRGKLLR